MPVKKKTKFSLQSDSDNIPTDAFKLKMKGVLRQGRVEANFGAKKGLK